MGGFANPAVYGLMAAGTASSAVGSFQQGKAAERAVKFNAALIQQETDQRLEQAFSESRRRRSANITRVAKSGVRLTGSPLAVLEENEYQDAQQRAYIRRSGEARANLMRTRGRNARAAARMGIAADVIGGAGRIGALAIRNA